jgi:hypothetical protein
MISGRARVSKVREAYDEKWGYIWGARGQTWTQAQQDRATRAMTVKHGQKWVGRKVADCSGLIKWAMRELGGDIYHGSNTMFNQCTEIGPLAGEVRIRIGTAVFQNTNGKRGHVGIYSGGGMVIEEHGTQAGIIKSPIATWDEWGVLPGTDVSDGIWEIFNILPMDTLSKGAKGELVKWLQRGLIEAGYDVGEDGADGVYGRETVSAVRAFQYDHSLASDGVVGAKTWAAIKAVVDDDEPNEDKPVEAPDEPQEPEDAWGTLTDAQKLDDLNKRVKALEGREPNG